MPYKNPEDRREWHKKKRSQDYLGYAARQKQYYIDHPEIYLLNACRSRAKKAGVPFNLTKEDFVIPKVCPVFGTPFERGTKGFHENAPSVDRINPKLGYVKGNVAIISFKANRIKCNSTADEIMKVALWLQGLAQQEQPSGVAA